MLGEVEPGHFLLPGEDSLARHLGDLAAIARFRLDPRDTRSDADYYELVGNESGVFGCMTLLGCEDCCPKDLTLSTQIAFLRRKMVFASSS